MTSNRRASLEKLKEQQAKLTARIQQMEARDKVAERKKDLRRKILVGSYYLDQVTQNNTWEDLQKIMETYLTRPNDRSLFDLSEKIEAAK